MVPMSQQLSFGVVKSPMGKLLHSNNCMDHPEMFIFSTFIDVFLAEHEAKVYKFTGGTFNHSKLLIDERWSMIENTNEDLYPAASLNNTIHGLARRRGLEKAIGEAYVIALGNVNPPETGALTFNQVKGRGVYAMKIHYRDCFSWQPCGTKFTRRWNLRVTVNDGEPTWISLKSSHHWLSQHYNHYTMGIILTQDGDNHIHFDNPDGFGKLIFICLSLFAYHISL